jgi:hypothetical protein
MNKELIDKLWNQAVRESDEDGTISTRYSFAALVWNYYSLNHAQMWLKQIDDEIKAEREACAKECDELAGMLFCHGDKDGAGIAVGLRDSIRARRAHETH